MPATVDKLNLHENGTDKKLDRRIKLTPQDKEDIRDRYFLPHESERPTMTSLAALYNVDRRLIQFILFPDREARNKEQASVRHRSGRYYSKDRGRKKLQRYRDYKRTLLKEGKLKAQTEHSHTNS